jgi:CheY-like chemotaxis protein
MQDRKSTILVIDDEPDVLEVETAVLGEFGYFVIPCARADEALAIVAGDTPLDMVLTDIVMMGGIDGWHLAEKMRTLRPSLKVVFTSGYVMPSTLAIVAARGELFLQKPWTAEALADVMRRALVS